MNMKCLIVDDEPLARKILVKYIASVESLELIKECSNASDAASVLHQHTIDLIFLDIKMPDMSGLELLNILPDPPMVIITTAHMEYAIEGYEYSVVDFLLKPFPFERFLKAVNTAFQRITGIASSSTTVVEDVDYIFLKADRVLHRVSLSEINYIQGYGNFLKVFTDNKMLLISETMANMEGRLPSKLFKRVHKSFIVSLINIESIEDGFIKVKNKEIPIGNIYKQQFYYTLKNMK